jgi:hypothetical protein
MTDETPAPDTNTRDVDAELRHANEQIERLTAELAALHAGEEPMPDSQHPATASAAQWLWMWNHTTPEERLARAQRILDVSQRATACFLENHPARIQELQRRVEKAETKVADYENRITWHTTCASCARILDSSIRETERAVKAEAELKALGRAAVEYQQRAWDAEARARQINESLRIAHETSNQSEIERAAAIQRAETVETRLRLAHEARRGKEHQLDDVRRALCDIGFMDDDDPYSHADLADVIRQNGQALREAGRTPSQAGGVQGHAGHGSPCEHRTDGTCAVPPTSALRDLVAAAIYERNNPGHCWAEAHPDDIVCYGNDADAALTATDWEQQKQRADQLAAEIIALRNDLYGITGARWIADSLDTILNRAAATEATKPVHNAGPTVAECAANDRRWPLEKAGE